MRIRGSVLLTNPAPDPDLGPTLDTIPFFSDLMYAKNYFFVFIFSPYNLPAGTLSSVLKIEFFAKIVR